MLAAPCRRALDRQPAPDSAALIATVPRWYHSLELAPRRRHPWVVRPATDLRPDAVARGAGPPLPGRRDRRRRARLRARAARRLARSWPSTSPLTRSGTSSRTSPTASCSYLRDRHRAAAAGGVPRRPRAAAARACGSRRSASMSSTPERLGSFDVVVCGSLLLHLRDPLRALAAIASVCRGELLCSNQIDLRRSVGPRRRPLVRLDGTVRVDAVVGAPTRPPTARCCGRAGLSIRRDSGLYSVPFGACPPPRARTVRMAALSAAERDADRAHAACRTWPCSPRRREGLSGCCPPPWTRCSPVPTPTVCSTSAAGPRRSTAPTGCWT